MIVAKDANGSKKVIPVTSLKEVRSALDYDPETGVFRWKMNRRGPVKKGDVAGTKSGRYSYITLAGEAFLSHRLAWFYVYERWPVNGIDHKDRNTRNNAIANLRDVPQTTNMQNVIADGASFDKKLGRWSSQIVACGVRKHLGSYATREEAQAAYRAAKRVLHADSPQADAPASEEDRAVLGHADGRVRTNTSGYTGVSFKAAKGLFEAHMRVNGKYKYVGLFATAKEASEARAAAIASGA